MTVVKELSKAKAVSILLRGGSKTIIDESRRSLHDAICVIRNLIKDPTVIVGGGASELSGAIHLRKIADQHPGVEQYAIRGFADALEQIPLILADNSGMNSIDSLSEARAKQIDEKSSVFGISCLTAKVGDMKAEQVFETFSSKKHQIQLAT